MALVPGSGAAGGLGAALVAFLERTLTGIQAILDYVDFDNLIRDADLVVTGGQYGWSIHLWKGTRGGCARCKPFNIPVIAVVGGMGPGAEKVYDYGIDSIITTVNRPMELDEALSRADELWLMRRRGSSDS